MQTVEVVAAIWLGLLGLIIGSFLNVVIARVPHGQSIVRPRSRCPRCGHQLSWYENVPVFSWIVLGGRCRSCREPISARYVVVEILTGLLFLACLARFGWTMELVRGLVLVMLLVPLTFIDLEHWLLPFSLTLPGIALGIVLALPLGWPVVVGSTLGALTGFASFWALEVVGERIFRKEALGGGDKYLLALLGAFLGWQSLLAIIFLSSLQGALVGVALLMIRGRAGPAPEVGGRANTGAEKPLADEPPVTAPSVRADEPSHDVDDSDEDEWEPGPTNIPFGPWLSLAALEVLLLGPAIATQVPAAFRWIIGGG